ncbi:MAG: hypothetical protein ACUVRT_02800, partial [Armatimonadota bacterium]
WNLFLDALNIPHSFSEDTIVPIGQDCAVQVRVVQEAVIGGSASFDKAREQQLEEWLLGRASCDVEHLVNWLGE